MIEMIYDTQMMPKLKHFKTSQSFKEAAIVNDIFQRIKQDTC